MKTYLCVTHEINVNNEIFIQNKYYEFAPSPLEQKFIECVTFL